jgi:alpha-1,2-mannosyltransferase
VSGTEVRPPARVPDLPPPGRPSRSRAWPGPVTLAVAAAAALALGLRAYQLTRPGYLFGLTEYDDGPYLGSALSLLGGQLPYRDFVLVQPPGITVLMVPAALVGKAAGTAWAMAAGRMLTTAASAAGTVLAGLLVRHRGAVAALVAAGVTAVYPDAVQAAHTVLVEPWLVLACLGGALLVFDGDRLAAGRRLVAGGVVFGLAGAVEAWAVVPVLVVTALCLLGPVRDSPAALPGAGLGPALPGRGLPGMRRRLRRAAGFAGGVTAGFCVPVLPFVAASPGGFYQSVIVAQVGPRAGVVAVPLWGRLKEMTGLTDFALPGRVTFPLAHGVPVAAAVAVLTAVALVLVIVGGLTVAWHAGRRRPAPLDWFAPATAAGTVAMFLWPSQFHYHFPAFLAPFLGLSIALPAGRLLAGRGGWPPRLAGGLAGSVIAVFTVVQAQAETGLAPLVPPAQIAAAARQIPPGACAATDEVSLLILAGRFVPASGGCPGVLDGLGTDLALSGGLKPETGAARAAAVAMVWQRVFSHARFAWLSPYSERRIAWSPALRGYFTGHFTRVWADSRGDVLYRREPGTHGTRPGTRRR